MLARAGSHYSGRAYPGYPHSSIAEAAEALELARWNVRHVGNEQTS